MWDWSLHSSFHLVPARGPMCRHQRSTGYYCLHARSHHSAPDKHYLVIFAVTGGWNACKTEASLRDYFLARRVQIGRWTFPGCWTFTPLEASCPHIHLPPPIHHPKTLSKGLLSPYTPLWHPYSFFFFFRFYYPGKYNMWPSLRKPALIICSIRLAFAERVTYGHRAICRCSPAEILHRSLYI